MLTWCILSFVERLFQFHDANELSISKEIFAEITHIKTFCFKMKQNINNKIIQVMSQSNKKTDKLMYFQSIIISLQQKVDLRWKKCLQQSLKCKTKVNFENAKINA